MPVLSRQLCGPVSTWLRFPPKTLLALWPPKRLRWACWAILTSLAFSVLSPSNCGRHPYTGIGGQIGECARSYSYNGFSILPCLKPPIFSFLGSELWSLDLCLVHLWPSGSAAWEKVQGVWSTEASPWAWTSVDHLATSIPCSTVQIPNPSPGPGPLLHYHSSLWIEVEKLCLTSSNMLLRKLIYYI